VEKEVAFLVRDPDGGSVCRRRIDTQGNYQTMRLLPESSRTF
jgi:hypothetical protein